MNEQTYEPEIDLKKVFFRILRDWKKSLIFSVIIAILVGCGYFTYRKIKISNQEYIAEQEKNYSYELASYEAKGETLKNEINNLTNSRKKQDEYNDNSILMKINPFRVVIASLNLYVDTDYQIMPGSTYQNIDLSSRILKAYSRYLTDGEMYQYIMDNLSYDLEVRYLDEIITVTEDFDNNMICLEIKQANDELCNEIIDLIKKGINNKKSSVQSEIGKHELSTVNNAICETVDLELDELQKQNIQYVSELATLIQEKNDEYKEWKTSSKPAKSYTTQKIIKTSIKNTIFGLIIGFICCSLIVGIHYVVSDKVQDTTDLKKRYQLQIIGELPKRKKEKHFLSLERLIAKMSGLTLKSSDYDEMIKVISISINAQQKDMDKDNTNMPFKLAFTGNLTDEELRAITDRLELDKNIQLINASNILMDSASIAKMKDVDYVILVEKQEQSTYSQIEREMESLHAWGKKIMGAIVIDVDAVPQ